MLVLDPTHPPHTAVQVLDPEDLEALLPLMDPDRMLDTSMLLPLTPATAINGNDEEEEGGEGDEGEEGGAGPQEEDDEGDEGGEDEAMTASMHEALGTPELDEAEAFARYERGGGKSGTAWFTRRGG